jgi:hypothetical protein
MNTKLIQQMMVGLIQGRMQDLETQDQMNRVLLKRIGIQKQLLGLVVDLLRDQFSENKAEFEEIAQIIDADDTGKELESTLNRGQFKRDQLEATIAEFKELLERSTDEE